MNETIGTLANTTIQDVVDDERIERLVRQIIEEKQTAENKKSKNSII